MNGSKFLNYGFAVITEPGIFVTEMREGAGSSSYQANWIMASHEHPCIKTYTCARIMVAIYMAIDIIKPSGQSKNYFGRLVIVTDVLLRFACSSIRLISCCVWLLTLII